MNRAYDVAQLLVSSWQVAGNDRLPTSQGLLDKALKAAVDQGTLPEWAVRELHFADSRTGLRCIELPTILELAQNGELTSAPNPSYTFADLKVSDRVARVFLRQLGVSLEMAQNLGRLLSETIKAQNPAAGAA